MHLADVSGGTTVGGCQQINVKKVNLNYLEIFVEVAQINLVNVSINFVVLSVAVFENLVSVVIIIEIMDEITVETNATTTNMDSMAVMDDRTTNLAETTTAKSVVKAVINMVDFITSNLGNFVERHLFISSVVGQSENSRTGEISNGKADETEEPENFMGVRVVVIVGVENERLNLMDFDNGLADVIVQKRTVEEIVKVDGMVDSVIHASIDVAKKPAAVRSSAAVENEA